MIVYLLTQTDDVGRLYDTTVGVFTNKQKVEKICKNLNDNYYVEDKRYWKIEEMLVDANYWLSGEYLKIK